MDSPDAMKNAVLSAVAEACYLKPEELRLEISLLDLGLDSLVITSIIAGLENLWHRSFRQDQLIALFEAGDLGDFLQKVLSMAAETSAALQPSGRASTQP
jgi:acyl carrier protein